MGNYKLYTNCQEKIERKKGGQLCVKNAHRLTHGQSCHALKLVQRDNCKPIRQIYGNFICRRQQVTKNKQLQCGESEKADTRQRLPTSCKGARCQLQAKQPQIAEIIMCQRRKKHQAHQHKCHVKMACGVGSSKSQNLSCSSTSFRCGCWQPSNVFQANDFATQEYKQGNGGRCRCSILST